VWQLVREQFDDKLVQILVGVAAASSLIALRRGEVHELTEPVIIMTILMLNAIVGVYHRLVDHSAVCIRVPA
jgi:magnesium-transporting ATPase (P-type)